MGSLALVGASVRAAAMSALRSGWSPVAADLFADADLCALCRAEQVRTYPWDFAAWLGSVQADAWLYTGGLENHPSLVDSMARHKPLLGNPGAVLSRVRSPECLGMVLRQHGFFFPEIRSTSNDLPRDGSWLVKTGRGSGGIGVQALDGMVSMGRQPAHGCGSSPSFFYQRRIEGMPGSAIFIATEDRTLLLGVTYQLIGASWTAARPFQYAGSIGPWPVGRAVLGVLRGIGDLLRCAFHLVGLFGVDFILSGNTEDPKAGQFFSSGDAIPKQENGREVAAGDSRSRDVAGQQVWVIEVNPRYTASVEIVERMIDQDSYWTVCHPSGGPESTPDSMRGVMAMHIAACRGQGVWIPPMAELESPFLYHGKAILFARQDIRVPRSFTVWALESNDDPLLPAVADIPYPGEEIVRGHPIATCLTSGPTPSEVIDRLQRQLAKMEAKLNPR